jgi:hypothetical protein
VVCCYRPTNSFFSYESVHSASLQKPSLVLSTRLCRRLDFPMAFDGTMLRWGGNKSLQGRMPCRCNVDKHITTSNLG